MDISPAASLWKSIIDQILILSTVDLRTIWRKDSKKIVVHSTSKGEGLGSVLLIFYAVIASRKEVVDKRNVGGVNDRSAWPIVARDCELLEEKRIRAVGLDLGKVPTLDVLRNIYAKVVSRDQWTWILAFLAFWNPNLLRLPRTFLHPLPSISLPIPLIPYYDGIFDVSNSGPVSSVLGLCITQQHANPANLQHSLAQRN